MTRHNVPRLPLWLLLAALLHGACAHDNATKAPAPLTPPTQFTTPEGAADGPSAALIDWASYFGEPKLIALVSEALDNNHDVLIALQRIEQARAGVRAATGALLPQLALGVDAGLRKYGLYTMDGAGNATTDITPGRIVPTNLPDYAVGLQASWEIDLWGKLRHQRGAALAQYLASVEASRLVVTMLVADVASYYFELVALDHERDILEGTLRRQSRALEAVRLQKEAGRANELAVQQFEAQLAETQALTHALAQTTLEVENQLNLLLGRYPRPIARDKATLHAPFPAQLTAGVPSDLLVNRPDIREAELLVQASEHDVASARAAFLPSLTLSAGVGFQAFSPTYLFATPESLTYNVVGGLLAPILNWTALQAQFMGATAAQLQALYAYQRTFINAYIEVVNTLSNLRASERFLEAKQAQKAALERSIETADVLFRAGKASYLEVLMAQQSSLDAELELVAAHKRARLATVALYKALGGGWR